ncbi:MAG TPA: glutathionylspermidine synthase family protein [Patescibacteria group bacterium]|nr:glutathionylspermidine synthase family protein [Patescibacteria group bacterium]
MKRIAISPRNNWQTEVEKLGFGFHTTDVPYWSETAYYSFDSSQIDTLERAAAELWQLCLKAVEFVIDLRIYHEFAIPNWMAEHIERSWNDDAPSVYGRFDLAYNGTGEPKLLEFNADTPTSLFEAAIVQWFWLQDFKKEKDQFNSIHEKLIEYWRSTKPYLRHSKLYFACVQGSLEDLTTTEYLRDTAIQAGLDTNFIHIEDIGWSEEYRVFVDEEGKDIHQIFKLYPWEWLVHEDFGRNIITDENKVFWIEPSWKMILSNKALLPLLWQLFPNHKNLLPTYRTPSALKSYVRKPVLSREGANIQIVREGNIIVESKGEYGEEGYVYQELYDLPNFDGNHPVIGSWIIGQQPAGIGIRETSGLITDNSSRFVPHLIE